MKQKQRLKRQHKAKLNLKDFKDLMDKYGLTIKDLPAFPPKDKLRELIILIGTQKRNEELEREDFFNKQ